MVHILTDLAKDSTTLPTAWLNVKSDTTDWFSFPVTGTLDIVAELPV